MTDLLNVSQDAAVNISQVHVLTNAFNYLHVTSGKSEFFFRHISTYYNTHESRLQKKPEASVD